MRQLYGLGDPRDGRIYYIGESTDPWKRYMSHLTASKYECYPVQSWVKHLLSSGLKPALIVLGYGDKSETIKEFILAGNPLLNIALTRTTNAQYASVHEMLAIRHTIRYGKQ